MIQNQQLEYPLETTQQHIHTKQSHLLIKKELFWATLVYAILTIIVTWPLVSLLNKAVGGFDGRDSFQHIWLFWWFWDALLNKQQLPSEINMLYFPQGSAHPVLWLHPLVPLLGIPLTHSLNPTITYNLILLTSFVIAGLTGYLLARYITQQWQSAFIGGLIFAFAPNRVGHTLAGHQLLAFNVTLPLYALALCLWLKQPSRRTSSLYTISLLLVLLGHPNFIGYFLLPLTLVLLAAYQLKHGWFSQKRWLLLFISWVVAGVLFLPFVWPTLTELTAKNLAYLQPKNVGEHSADLLSFFTPSPFHPLWQETPPTFTTLTLDRPRAMEEGFNYLGFTVLLLAGIAVWRQWSRIGPWLIIAVLTGLLSLGPILKVGGQTINLPMPYMLLTKLPFFSWSRTPGRFNMTTMIAVSVIAAIGAALLITQCRQRKTRWGLLLALTGLIIVEYLPMWPFPVDSRSISPYYYQLSSTQTKQGLLDMPVSGSRRASNYAMFYQTVHHKPLVGGYIERDPPGTEELRLFADRLLSPPPISDDIILTPSPAQRIAILHSLKVTEVVAHPALLTDRAARATLSFIPVLLGEPHYSDDDLLAWHVPPLETTLPPYSLLLTEKGWEAINDGTLLRLKEEGLLFIYAHQSGPARLKVKLHNPPPTGTQVWVNDVLQSNGEELQYQISLQLTAKLNWVSFRLTNCENCEAEFSGISLIEER